MHLMEKTDHRNRLRVLHVVATGSRRGGEVFASDLVRALADKGINQHVAILRSCVRPSIDFNAPVTALTNVDDRRRGSALDPRILWELRRTLKLVDPDVLLAHGGEPLKYAIPSKAARRTPVIYRRIGSIRGRTALRGTRLRGYQALMRRADAVVAVADAVREETIDRFRVPRSRVLTIPNAVDIERLHPNSERSAVRESLGICPTESLIVSVGALTWEKDPLAQLEVVETVMDGRRDSRFAIVGDGPLGPSVESTIRESRHRDRIQLLGARDDVEDILAAGDVLLLGSRSEGMPGILIEAGMVGLPVVASAVGGVPEVVVDGVTGLLTAPDDRAAMASALKDLVGDEHRRRSLGRAARYRCTRLFDIRPVADRYLRILDRRRARP
jgi:glycosyltransferase involved in cell wall biosynthesis